MNKPVLKQVLIILVFLVALIWGASLVHAERPADPGPQLKQVFCNIEGNSGKFKVQIGGKGTEHEKPVLIDGKTVFVQSEKDVTPAMEAFCASIPEVPKPPVGCKIGTFQYYNDPDTKQDPVCKDGPTGTTADDPNKGEVKSTTPTPVEDTVYPDFQGK